MAFTVDPVTYVISVPKSDLTLVSGTLYELDTEQFRLDLRDWEDSEEGIVQPKTHDHATTYTVAGVTYARGIIVLPPYSIEFEDGQYSIILKNSNNNIFDIEDGILVQNQVQVIPTNAAGLIVSVTAGSGLTPGEASDLSTAASESTTAAAQASIAAAEAAFARKLQSNRAVIAADDLSVIIYDDDSVTPLLTFDVSEDKRERSRADDVVHLWTAESGTAGATYPDGDEAEFWMHRHNADDKVVYAQRDGTDVAQFHIDPVYPAGRPLSFRAFPPYRQLRNLRLKGLFYMDESWYTAFALRFSQDYQKALLYVQNNPGWRGLEVQGQIEDPVTHLNSELDDITARNYYDGVWTAGWVQFTFEVLADGTIRGNAWQPPTAEPAGWIFESSGFTFPPSHKVMSMDLALVASETTTTIELAWMSFEEFE